MPHAASFHQNSRESLYDAGNLHLLRKKIQSF
jgi:hypothetical protein